MKMRNELEVKADELLDQVSKDADGLAEELKVIGDLGSVIITEMDGKAFSKTSDKLTYIIDQLHALKIKAQQAEMIFDLVDELRE